MTPTFRDVSPEDPIAYVLSLNLHRRHLTASQRAMVGSAARELYQKAAKDRQRKSGGDKVSPKSKAVPKNSSEPLQTQTRGDTRDLVGKAVGVSGYIIDQATKVRENAAPELIKAVEEGRVTVNRMQLAPQYHL